MRIRYWLILAASLGIAGCTFARGFKGVLAPATQEVSGVVYLASTNKPIPYAEVCAFGADTTCDRADGKGHYSLFIVPQVVTLRFRYNTNSPPGLLTNVSVTSAKPVVANCALSDRVSLNLTPVPCLNVQADSAGKT